MRGKVARVVEEGLEPKELREDLERWTEEHCGWEEDRDYLGMSGISECPAELYDRLVDGRGPVFGRAARLRYEECLHKRDLVKRLEGLGSYEPGCEVVADFDERFQGHTDGEVAGLLLDVESVTRRDFKEVRARNRALQGHYEQVQCYLRYGGWERAVVLYKCRETGEVRPIMVWPHFETQERLERKAREVLEAVDRGERPACECGRH